MSRLTLLIDSVSRLTLICSRNSPQVKSGYALVSLPDATDAIFYFYTSATITT